MTPDGIEDSWNGGVSCCPPPAPRSSAADEDLLAAPCDDGTGVGLAVWAGVGHTWPPALNDLLLDWLQADADRRD